jgi:transcription antitermination factor NusG
MSASLFHRAAHKNLSERGEALNLTGDTPITPVSGIVSPESCWYAVHTRARHEKKVTEHLRATCCDAFIPLYRRNQQWKNGICISIDFPLFPGYVFARITRGQRHLALGVPGVVCLAGPPAHPTPLAGEEIESLRIATSALNAHPHPFINVGDRVRIIAGALAGLEGLLLRRANQVRVVLSVESIMRCFTVEVNLLDIEPIRATSPRVI